MTATLLFVLLAVSTTGSIPTYLEVKTFDAGETCERIAAQLNTLGTTTRYRCETAVVPDNLRGKVFQ